MGSGTRYLGRLDITPPLNDAESDWLRAFAEIDRRHYSHPYDVAMNPRVLAQEDRQAARGGTGQDGLDAFRSLASGDGSPYSNLDWTPCMDGCCLRWTGREKSRMARQWLGYLIDHFLRPGAHAQSTDRPEFAHFTFDHVVSGIIAGEHEETGELSLIVACDNTLHTETLVPAVPPGMS